MEQPVPEEIDLADLTRSPAATFVWGESRAVVKRVLYALVRLNDPHFYWLDIRGPDNEFEDPNPVDLGWLSPDHLFVASETAGARLRDTVGNLALWSIVRADAPDRVRATLSDFLDRPAVVREMLGRAGIREGPHAVAIANTDRVRGHDSRSPEGAGPILAPLLAASISPFFGGVAPPGRSRRAFDFIFEVRAPRLSAWETGWLICEKAPDGSSFLPPQAIALRSLPEIAGVLYGEAPLL